MARKMNPKSLENLKMGQSPGRKTIYSKSKSRHGVTLTDDAWARVQELADQLGVVDPGSLESNLEKPAL